MANITTERILVPQGATKQLILEHAERTKNRKDFAAHYFYLLHTIKTRPYIDRRYKTGDFIPVNNSILKGIISERQIKTIKKFLVKNNILICNKSYQVGEVSKTYKLNIETTGNYWLYETIDDKLLQRKIHTHKKYNMGKIKGKGKGYEIANYWLHDIEIDYRKAYQYAHKYRSSDNEKYNAYSYSLKELQLRKYRSLIDDNNRMHHNISNLASVFRKHLYIESKPLGQIDITNSQPLFLYIHLTGIESIDNKELIRYGETCLNGSFYETIAQQSGFDLNKNSRKTFKTSVFTSVFFGKHYEIPTPVEQAFKELYPTIYNYITTLKQENGYKVISHVLQKSEAEFIYKAITHINKETGQHKIPLLAIHDCIVTTAANLDIVCEKLKQYFVLKLEILPTLKTEKY
jgi:hypothetical protein